MTRTNIPGTSPYEPIIGFSRAVRIGNHVHVSGTGPVGADDGDITQQTEQCLNLIATANSSPLFAQRPPWSSSKSSLIPNGASKSKPTRTSLSSRIRPQKLTP